MVRSALVIGGIGLGAVLLGRRFAPNCGAFDVEKMLDRMPDTAPPKWMFQNISAIRENTERILERLEEHEYVPAPDEREGIAT